MKYCSHCGTELFDEAVICPKCGCPAGEIKTANTTSENWNGLAIAGFIVSFFSCVVGLILSIIGLKKIRKSGEKGRGLAIAGIIISAVEMAIIFIILVLEIALWWGIFLSQLSNYSYALLLL